MIVSDGTIREMLLTGYLSVSPIEESQIQPASIDVRLGNTFQTFPEAGKGWVVDPFSDNSGLAERHRLEEGQSITLGPGAFALGSTVESVRVPRDLVARVEGKSSLARLGLAVHATAGFIDPGFSGHITLEFSNLLPYGIRLTPGMKIAQLSFQTMESAAERPYGSVGLNSKYQDQREATASAYHLNS